MIRALVIRYFHPVPPFITKYHNELTLSARSISPYSRTLNHRNINRRGQFFPFLELRPKRVWTFIEFIFEINDIQMTWYSKSFVPSLKILIKLIYYYLSLNLINDLFNFKTDLNYNYWKSKFEIGENLIRSIVEYLLFVWIRIFSRNEVYIYIYNLCYKVSINDWR